MRVTIGGVLVLVAAQIQRSAVPRSLVSARISLLKFFNFSLQLSDFNFQGFHRQAQL
jgi:hypothetical protein